MAFVVTWPNRCYITADIFVAIKRCSPLINVISKYWLAEISFLSEKFWFHGIIPACLSNYIWLGAKILFKIFLDIVKSALVKTNSKPSAPHRYNRFFFYTAPMVRGNYFV